MLLSTTYLRQFSLATLVALLACWVVPMQAQTTTITTQAEMDAFEQSPGVKVTTVVNLTIRNEDTGDPITDDSNLSELAEVSGSLNIQRFNQTGNSPVGPNDPILLYLLLAA
jgi:hypothetical protein